MNISGEIVAEALARYCQFGGYTVQGPSTGINRPDKEQWVERRNLSSKDQLYLTWIDATELNQLTFGDVKLRSTSEWQKLEKLVDQVEILLGNMSKFNGANLQEHE